MADLREGESAEVAVRDYLNSNTNCHYKKSYKTSTRSDMSCLYHGEMVEVKLDRKAPATGNICFEQNLFKKTASATVVYVIGDVAYLFDTRELAKAIIELHSQGQTKYMKLGDRNANPAILVKSVLILPIAREIKLGETE